MYLVIYSIGFIGSLLAFAYIIIKYALNVKYLISVKGDIVDWRYLSLDEVKQNEGGNFLVTVEYIYDEERYSYSYKTTRLKIPKKNEKVDIIFNTKKRTISQSSGGSAIVIMTIFIAFFAYNLYMECNRTH